MSRRKNLQDELGKRSGKSFGGPPDNDYFDRDFAKDDDWGFGTKTTSGSGSPKKSSHAACYHSHPALLMPGTSLVIYGGNCGSPVVPDADVYIGLDKYSARISQRSWPWKKGTEFIFDIPDMGVPALPEEFLKLINWIKVQLEKDLKVHVGCIGGHGRTGMVLAGLVSLFGEKDAITYVRKHYCQKAVESSSQVKFLGTHCGILPVTGSKSSTGVSGGTKGSGSGTLLGVPKGTSGQTSFAPVVGAMTIWG